MESPVVERAPQRMNFITISKTSGEMNTHQRKNDTSLYPLLPTIVVTTHLSISRRYFSQRLVWKMALWRSPSGWCLMHFEVILTRRSRLIMQTIHFLNGSWWIVVSLQWPMPWQSTVQKVDKMEPAGGQSLGWPVRSTTILRRGHGRIPWKIC